MKAAAFLLCVLILMPAQEAISGGNSEHSEWSGTYSPYQLFSAQVIRDSDSWSQLWAELRRPPPQVIHAGRHMALAVFLGLRRTGGYDLVIEPAGQTETVQLFRVRELAPAPDAFVAQVLTTPYRIIVLPASTRAVLFLAGFDGAASGECLYIPAGEQGRAEKATQLPDNPPCSKIPVQPNEGS